MINGQKIWTSYANYADWCFCLVRTDTSVKHEGISFVLIDMATPGVPMRCGGLGDPLDPNLAPDRDRSRPGAIRHIWKVDSPFIVGRPQRTRTDMGYHLGDDRRDQRRMMVGLDLDHGRRRNGTGDGRTEEWRRLAGDG